jgi:hypothetical protein
MEILSLSVVIIINGYIIGHLKIMISPQEKMISQFLPLYKKNIIDNISSKYNTYITELEANGNPTKSG